MSNARQVKALQQNPSFPGVEGPVLLVVMDGVGVGRGDEGDAVKLARTPTLDLLHAGHESCVYTEIAAHGTAVGLPSDDDMGNSEVGHNAIGAGQVFDQGAKRINAAFESGEVFEGEVWKALVERVRESGQPMHFIGLLSDGNVHSHIKHLLAMLRRCAEEKVKRVRVHALLDGRDVPETSALDYVEQLEKVLKELQEAGFDYRVASGGGRMKITMDRYEADWDMVQRGWRHHVLGEGEHFPSLSEAVESLRDKNPGVTDQNLPGFVIADDDGPVGPIRDGASVIFFNFRGDRAIEISKAFEQETFEHFDRGERPDVLYAGMMQYDGDEMVPQRYLVDPPNISNTLGAYLAASGVPQFACSETQKYGHVTYFWNGNRSGKFDQKLETYVEIPSDNLPFEQRPWMKSAEITDATIRALGDFRFGRINYANGDMVGHTGDRDSTVVAVEAVDLGIRRLLPEIKKRNGALIVTADHGNADQMYEIDKKSGDFQRGDKGQPKAKTSHTLNAVPLYIWAPGHELKLQQLERAGLANLAATSAELLGFKPPEAHRSSLLKW